MAERRSVLQAASNSPSRLRLVARALTESRTLSKETGHVSLVPRRLCILDALTTTKGSTESGRLPWLRPCCRQSMSRLDRNCLQVFPKPHYFHDLVR
jgi:hypothetical protein